MSDAVLLDLVYGCGPGCRGASLREEPACPCHVFLLCRSGYPHEDRLSAAFLRSCWSVHVLDSGSTAERLYRFKQTVDQLDLSSVRVLTTPRGRGVLRAYQEQLFTAVYTFEYQIDQLTCPGCAGSAHSDSPGEAVSVEEEVSGFLQQLPALKGEVRVLKSSLIPECFGHGFSTRSGGVSYIPTLSSLNLFSSKRRRDPGAVVQENRRRLALHAGFHPQPLCLVKVDHGSHVWVVGSAEPENYDAVVTDRTEVVLAAPGADCMPILFADPVSKVIGAAHAVLEYLYSVLRLEGYPNGHRYGDGGGHGEGLWLPGDRHRGCRGTVGRRLLLHTGQTSGAGLLPGPPGLCPGSRVHQTTCQHSTRQQSPPPERRHPP